MTFEQKRKSLLFEVISKLAKALRSGMDHDHAMQEDRINVCKDADEILGKTQTVIKPFLISFYHPLN